MRRWKRKFFGSCRKLKNLCLDVGESLEERFVLKDGEDRREEKRKKFHTRKIFFSN